jgi:hypothetical protein
MGWPPHVQAAFELSILGLVRIKVCVRQWNGVPILRVPSSLGRLGPALPGVPELPEVVEECTGHKTFPECLGREPVPFFEP